MVVYRVVETWVSSGFRWLLHCVFSCGQETLSSSTDLSCSMFFIEVLDEDDVLGSLKPAVPLISTNTCLNSRVMYSSPDFSVEFCSLPFVFCIV